MVAVGVCGFGRCGSTMIMRMLHAGGLEPVAGTSMHSYEVPTSDGFPSLTAEQLDGRSVKLLEAIKYDLMPRADVAWRFIWLDRNPREQSRSYAKFLRDMVGVAVDDRAIRMMRRAMMAERDGLVAALRDLGPVLELSFEETLLRPLATSYTIADWLDAQGIDLSPLPMHVVVHERGPRCLPTLQFERTGVPA